MGFEFQWQRKMVIKGPFYFLQVHSVVIGISQECVYLTIQIVT